MRTCSSAASIGTLLISIWINRPALAEDSKSDLPLPKVYKSLVVGADAIAASSKHFLDVERATARLQEIRKALTLQLLARNFDSNFVLADTKGLTFSDPFPNLSNVALLCDARAAHIRTLAQYSYLGSVVTKISDLSKPTAPTDLISALTTLFARYSEKHTTSAALSEGAIKSLQAEDLAQCKKDIENFDVPYYGAQIRQPTSPSQAPPPSQAAIPSFSIFGPIGVLIDTVLGVVTPVIIQIATIVDEAKREAAIKAFLTDPKNQEAIKNAGHNLAHIVAAYAQVNRQKLAASVVENLAVIRNAQINLSKIENCKKQDEKFSRGSDKTPSEVFILCWRGGWESIEPTVLTMLKLADDYDQLADAGNANTILKNFDVITSDLSAIRENAVTNPDLLWRYVIQMASFANSLQSAFSKENRDKLHEAINGLTKGPK